MNKFLGPKAGSLCLRFKLSWTKAFSKLDSELSGPKPYGLTLSAGRQCLAVGLAC